MRLDFPTLFVFARRNEIRPVYCDAAAAFLREEVVPSEPLPSHPGCLASKVLSFVSDRHLFDKNTVNTGTFEGQSELFWALLLFPCPTMSPMTPHRELNVGETRSSNTQEAKINSDSLRGVHETSSLVDSGI